LCMSRFRVRELLASGAIRGRTKTRDGVRDWSIDLDSVIAWEARIRGAAPASSAIARRAQVAGVGAEA
jgi:hypothetical protein